MRMYGRRRKLSAEETAANAVRRAEREAAAMTCQCCGIRYLANTGTIAHHAYERPGQGWQTASCMGAKYPPFEASRDRLGDLIDWYRDQHARHVAERETINDETNGFNLSYTDYAAPRDRRFGHPSVSFIVTRATFDALVAEHGPKVRHSGIAGNSFWISFDEEKTAELKNRDRVIADLLSEWKHQTWRYATWTATHIFKVYGPDDKKWEKLT